jgi:hypothetical protein
MKVKKQILLLLSAVGITGCTTIGQQITNHSGTIQLEQTNVPLTAQATDSTTASINNGYTVYTPNLVPYKIESVLNTNKTSVTNNTLTNNSTKISTETKKNQTTNSIINENIKSYETNNVVVNVYTETVSIEKSSFLSDAFNYFLE